MASYKSILILTALIVVIGTILPAQTLAYVGPGAGLSLIGSLIGLFVATTTAFIAVLLWPIRSWLRRRKTTRRR